MLALLLPLLLTTCAGCTDRQSRPAHTPHNTAAPSAPAALRSMLPAAAASAADRNRTACAMCCTSDVPLPCHRGRLLAAAETNGIDCHAAAPASACCPACCNCCGPLELQPVCSLSSHLPLTSSFFMVLQVAGRMAAAVRRARGGDMGGGAASGWPQHPVGQRLVHALEPNRRLAAPAERQGPRMVERCRGSWRQQRARLMPRGPCRPLQSQRAPATARRAGGITPSAA